MREGANGETKGRKLVGEKEFSERMKTKVCILVAFEVGYESRP